MATRFAGADGAPAVVTLWSAGTRWAWLLVAAAWAAALVSTLTGQRYLIDHHYLLEESGLAWPVAAAVFLACWQVMIAAMMLPSSMPALALMLAASRSSQRRPPPRAALVFLAGYAAPWTVFALLAFAGDTAIHHAVDAWPWLAAHAFLIGAVTLAGAGIFQLTALKGRCLAACHDPRALFAQHYRPRLASAWRIGARYGALSIGCCWGLMLIMFGIGVGGLGWMAVLTGAMLVEEVFPRGRQTRLALGIALLLLAGLWLLHPAWLVPSGAA
ncbi:MAG TPA: DUF2182 domain-containing protein [Ktedonobacterales bacterium]